MSEASKQTNAFDASRVRLSDAETRQAERFPTV
jgi:hypothetical protein